VDEDQLSLAIGRNGQNVRLASELTGWKIDLYSSREWLERAGEAPLFAPLPEEAPDDAADVKLSEIQGLETATVAVLEEAGYRTLNDVIDLERDDLLRLPGIAPGEADRIMAIINELTEEGAADDADGQAVAGNSSETADAGAHTDATAGAASGGSGSGTGGGASA
jgi:N utilization substance protein A